MTSYRIVRSLSKSAEITYQNMQTYYAYYGVDWQLTNILEQISDLDNWDIISNGDLIGALRLSFDKGNCYLRDLQVSDQYRNKGVGAQALNRCIQLAKQSGANKIVLRVFKISPAQNLYKRKGFIVVNEDDRFYYMELKMA